MKPVVREEVLTKVLEDTDSTELKDLVVFNDDVNTFDHVIDTLIKVCKHTPHQAEQCTLIIHHVGKCAVRKGVYEELKPMRQGVCDAGISAEIL